LHNHPSSDLTPSQAERPDDPAIIDIATPLGIACTTTSFSARTAMPA
jgi:DNA repair protein RadC